MRKTNIIFVVERSFEKIDFFQPAIKKVGFIKLIMSKFQIQTANLWLIYSKRIEFLTYNLFCVFWEIKFSDFWGPL